MILALLRIVTYVRTAKIPLPYPDLAQNYSEISRFGPKCPVMSLEKHLHRQHAQLLTHTVLLHKELDIISIVAPALEAEDAFHFNDLKIGRERTSLF